MAMGLTFSLSEGKEEVGRRDDTDREGTKVDDDVIDAADW